MLNTGNKILICSEFCTVRHFPTERKWICVSWGEFSLGSILDLPTRPKFTFYLDDRCHEKEKMAKTIQNASQRYLAMENNNNSTEKFIFVTKNCWKHDKEKEEMKFKKALHFLLKDLQYSVTLENRSLIFQLLKMIFFNKPK